MGKISDYTRVLAAKLADVFVVDQTDNGTTETKSATVEQIGTAIGTLQNFADLDTSNKNLVDAINEIASYTPVYGNTASGAIATFDTSLALPLQDCTIGIQAVQESGTPTPSSPKAISGFTGANIKVQSRNWIPLTVSSIKSANQSFTWSDNVGTYHALTITLLTDDGITITGIKVNGTANAATNIMTPTYSVQGSYILNGCVSGGTIDTYYLACRVNGNWLTTARDFGNGVTINGTITQSAITIANGAQINNLVFKPMLRVSTDTDSTYTPYTANTTAITWQTEAGIVYGGSLKVYGNGTVKLPVTHGAILLDGSQGESAFAVTTYANYTRVEWLGYRDVGILDPVFMSDKFEFVSGIPQEQYKIGGSSGGVRCWLCLPTTITTKAEANAWFANNPTFVRYPLATPVEYTLTSIPPIYTLKGTNNIFGDTNGNTSVVYACSLKDYIDSQ